MGYPVYNSDKEARKLMNEDTLIVNSLKDWFGDDIYLDGQLNRENLASQIFQNEQLRQRVNQLVHPIVRKAFVEWTQQQNHQLVFNEAAILYETGSYKKFDNMILVTAPLELRITRITNRDGITRDQVLDRMETQWDDDKKLSFGPFEIINDGSSPLLLQIEEVISQILKE